MDAELLADWGAVVYSRHEEICDLLLGNGLGCIGIPEACETQSHMLARIYTSGSACSHQSLTPLEVIVAVFDSGPESRAFAVQILGLLQLLQDNSLLVLFVFLLAQLIQELLHVV